MNTAKLVSVAAGALLAAGISTAAMAAGHGSSPVKGHWASGSFKLRNGAVSFGSGGGTLAAGTFNAIDSPVTLNCPSRAPSGCTITVTSMIQLQTPDGLWAICPEVNGGTINPPCPYQGSIAAGGSSFVTGNDQSSLAVAAGSSNSVQTTVYVNSTSTLANWQSTYAIYKN